MNFDFERLLQLLPPTGTPPIRPPGSHSEARFTNVCDGCQECIKTCSQLILVKGTGNLPEVDFSNGHCTFCLECIHACAIDALVLLRDQPLWTLSICVDDDICLTEQGDTCTECAEACENTAIRFASKSGRGLSLEVEPAACTGCGACIEPCPVDAIFLENMPSPRPIAS